MLLITRIIGVPNLCLFQRHVFAVPQARPSLLGLDKLAAIKREEDKIQKENGGSRYSQWEGVCDFLITLNYFY